MTGISLVKEALKDIKISYCIALQEISRNILIITDTSLPSITFL